MTLASARAIAAAVERRASSRSSSSCAASFPRLRTLSSVLGTNREEGDVQVHSSALVGGPYAQSLCDSGGGRAMGHRAACSVDPAPGSGRDRQHPSHARTQQLRPVLDAACERAMAVASLTLHAEPSAVVSRYLFRSPQREFTLPEPNFSRPALLAQAAGDLVHAVESGKSDHRCDMRLGLDTVDALIAAARSLDTGTAVDVMPRSA